MPYISWIEEADAVADVADGYRMYFERRPNRTNVADIIKCFSHRPDFMKQVMRFSWDVHFCDGHLPERVKELIATYVSGQNRCTYCMNSHGYFLHQQGESDGVVRGVGSGNLRAADISPAERELLRFAGILTHESHEVRAQDVEQLRTAGWTDPQIAEAVYITAMFNFFNRVANGFGLADPRFFELNGKSNPLDGVLPRQ